MPRLEQEKARADYSSNHSATISAIETKELSEDPNTAHDDLTHKNPRQPSCPHADVHVDTETRDLVTKNNNRVIASQSLNFFSDHSTKKVDSEQHHILGMSKL